MDCPGLVHLREYLDHDAQSRLAAELRAAVAVQPLFRPVMPRTGALFGVRMLNFGPLGWVSDRAGYRYQSRHPQTGEAWPPIPGRLLALWQDVAGYGHEPEACLLNYYEPGTRMGMHRDADEEARDAPVVSVSLGDTAIFRIGGPARQGPTRRIELRSGDVLVMGGASRHVYHGIDRILPGTSALLDRPGRINLTLRRVTRPAA